MAACVVYASWSRGFRGATFASACQRVFIRQSGYAVGVKSVLSEEFPASGDLYCAEQVRVRTQEPCLHQKKVTACIGIEMSRSLETKPACSFLSAVC